jgi:hypothetical protein
LYNELKSVAAHGQHIPLYCSFCENKEAARAVAVRTAAAYRPYRAMPQQQLAAVVTEVNRHADWPQIETRLGFADGRYRGFRAPHELTPLNSPGPYDPSAVKGEYEGGPSKIPIFNARLLDPPATLATHGFQLVTAPVPESQRSADGSCAWHEADAGPSGWYEYAGQVVQQATGCAAVRLPRTHEYRNGHGHLKAGDKYSIKPTPNGSSGTYGMGIHSDMSNTAELGWKPREGSSSEAERHWMMVKVWRSTDMLNDVEVTPLAVCDINTVHPNDMIDNDGQNTGDINMYRTCGEQHCSSYSSSCDSYAQEGGTEALLAVSGQLTPVVIWGLQWQWALRIPQSNAGTTTLG